MVSDKKYSKCHEGGDLPEPEKVEPAKVAPGAGSARPSKDGDPDKAKP